MNERYKIQADVNYESFWKVFEWGTDITDIDKELSKYKFDENLWMYATMKDFCAMIFSDNYVQYNESNLKNIKDWVPVKLFIKYNEIIPSPYGDALVSFVNGDYKKCKEYLTIVKI